jgi:hypothetical protein
MERRGVVGAAKKVSSAPVQGGYMDPFNDMNPIANPESISRFKKERFLLSKSEDDFRDSVVRPLFLRQGMKDGRDMCGPMEKGKDAVFATVDKLGMEDFYVLQTKKGSLTMSSKSKDNVIQAITQLRTALATKIPLIAKHKKATPSKAILCCSGKINESSREYIQSEVNDPRTVFMDSDELIPKIDEVYPELWLGIDAEIFPYLRSLKQSVDSSSETLAISDIVANGTLADAATDSMFVPLRVFRTVLKPRKINGQMVQDAQFEEFPVTGLSSRSERLILILGDAGAGKSTSLKRIAYVLADRGFQADSSFKIPVLVRSLDVWNNLNRPLVDVLVDSTLRLMRSSRSCFSADELKSGRILVLMDSLDELADNNCRDAVVAKIKEFHTAYPKCQIILTSRDYAFIRNLQSLSDFSQFHLGSLNYKQAQQILTRFEKKKSLTPEKSKEILRRLQEVHGMELNPLLVTVFAATTDYSRRDIPANITELFKKYTEMMLGRWDANKGLKQQYHAPLKDFLLQKVGYEMHRRNATNMSLVDLNRMVVEELENRGHSADAAELLDEILYRSGLLRICGDSAEFRHHLLQEFFAGRGIPDKQLLQTYAGSDWWQRAIVFYFGEHPDEAEGFSLIIGSLTGRPPMEVFSASLTVGLALQACYLLKTEERLRFLPWVITSLAKSQEDALKAFQTVGSMGNMPLHHFVGYYLLGRDAVAWNILADKFPEITAKVLEDNPKGAELDRRTFWLIVGLMETGEMETAKELIQKFKPEDARLLLAIQLGCFMIEHLRVAERDERKIAAHISASLSDIVSGLRRKLLDEFKTHLFEIRKGKVQPILPPPAETASTTACE